MSRKAATGLDGLRVLIIEDQTIVMMMIEDVLTDLGCVIVGHSATTTEALKLLHQNCIDAAVLDINLGKEDVYPLADELAARKVPFIFLTGYGKDDISARHADIPIVQKPVTMDALRRAMVERLGSHRNRAGRIASPPPAQSS